MNSESDVTPDMKTDLRSNLLYLLRATGVLLVAAVAAGAVFYSVLYEIRVFKNLNEGGIVESAQVAVLGLACLAYAIQAARSRDAGVALALVALAILAMLVRELDGLFDRLAGDHHVWSYVDAAVVLAMAAVALRRFSRTVEQLARFVATPQCLLLAAGVVFAVVVAQLIGYKEIWNRIFDVEVWKDAHDAALERGASAIEIDIARHAKNTVEESFELGSYLLILGSALVPPLRRAHLLEKLG